MTQKQTKRAERGIEPLLCTYGDCQREQGGEGEFCDKHILKYGDYAEMTDRGLLAKRSKIFKTIDTYLEERHKKGKTLERIKIRGVSHAINELIEVERELTLRENQ